MECDTIAQIWTTDTFPSSFNTNAEDVIIACDRISMPVLCLTCWLCYTILDPTVTMYVFNSSRMRMNCSTLAAQTSGFDKIVLTMSSRDTREPFNPSRPSTSLPWPANLSKPFSIDCYFHRSPCNGTYPLP